MTARCDGHDQHLLQLRDLHVHYGPICALHDVTLDFSCGTAVALIGGNGAGKSSLMKGIVGLVSTSSGSVVWRGEPITRSTHEITYLPQRADIDWSFPMTVRGLVEMGRYPLLGPLKRFSRADGEAVERALATMRIEELAERQVGALSGGQQQRALIARALAQEAHVLLLDEPFAGLDKPAQDLLSQLLRDLAESGHLILASHHELHTVGSIFHEAVLLNGHVIAHGPAADAMSDANLKQAFGGAQT